MPDAGRLRVCATPIGNLGDVTLRVLDALREADVIEAEDTRVTRRLLARYDIHTRIERYDEATAAERTPLVVARVQAGETVALTSDAGMPGISDPGARLVDACIDAGLAVDVLPGPSAVPAALVASGLPTRAFFFGGFLPRKEGERRRLLASLASLEATLVFYESPRRAAASARSLAEAFPARRAAMVRELTKVHEEVLRGTTGELASALGSRELQGELVLLVGPPVPCEQPSVDDDALRAAVDRYVEEGLSRKDAVKRVAEERGLPRQRVYSAAHRVS
ncbi:MAG: 16S rRNA (cytidine(1402)-2'-O)-methyltransferase [Coriobacteriales bacterium]|nr:16S rRNA (cytidine(1402)-2'-O)-methyltransferase [Actinomycetes bacterium]